MRAGWLVGFLFASVTVQRAFASPDSLPIQPSPDGKWVFEAVWFGTEDPMAGYLSDIKEAATGRIAYQYGKPGKNEMLPHRLETHWSPDSRRLAIDCFYGRIAFGFNVLTLDENGKWVEVYVPWPGDPRRMIHPADRARWVGSSVINVSIEGWIDKDTLKLNDCMQTTMLEPDGTKEEITSTRERVIRLSGKAARTISTSPPDYDELGH